MDKVWSSTQEQYVKWELIGYRWTEDVDLSESHDLSDRFSRPDWDLWIRPQLKKILKAINRDPTTRQALVCGWPDEVLQGDKPPCIFAMQVLPRPDRVDVVFYVRSWGTEKVGGDKQFMREVCRFLHRVYWPKRAVRLTVLAGSYHEHEGVAR